MQVYTFYTVKISFSAMNIKNSTKKLRKFNKHKFQCNISVYYLLTQRMFVTLYMMV